MRVPVVGRTDAALAGNVAGWLAGTAARGPESREKPGPVR